LIISCIEFCIIIVVDICGKGEQLLQNTNCTGWHKETGNFEVTLTKVRKMNLQVLLLKTKSKLHAIKCSNKNNSISKNNVHKMMAIQTYAFLEANSEISHGTLKHFHGN
jgi:hypothetical protein